MPLPDDDRRALQARLATTALKAVDVLAVGIDDGEELREVLFDIHGDDVALTATRALFVAAGQVEVRAFEYADIDVRQRTEGLGIDALVEDGRLVLDVARATFVLLGVVAQGAPPGRATWLPAVAPVPRAVPKPPTEAPVPDAPTEQGPHAATQPFSKLPPPGWHPDPSGRHWWRWWDGRGWTDHVADGGAPYLDQLPPR